MQAAANQPARWKRPLYWVIALVVVGLLIAGAFFLRARANPNQADEVQTGDQVTAFIGDLSASATASGQIEAVRSAKLSVEQPGYVETILVTAGTPVRAGDPLLQLDQRDLALQVERMQQNVTLKEAESAGIT